MVVNKETSDHGTPIGCSGRPPKSEKKPAKAHRDDVIDITDEVRRNEGKLEEGPTYSEFSNPMEREKVKRTSMALNAIHQALECDISLGKRKKQLAANQTSPFVGSSTVKRMHLAKGCVPSSAIYDPLGPIVPAKLKQLLDMIEEEE